MLLHHIRGPSSFQGLRTVNGTVCPTFQAACQEIGLLENDEYWNDTHNDAALLQSPYHLRELFSIIIVFCQPSNCTSLWATFQQYF